jgi:pimeloyl-ACP methyl ester carboxylesterase
MSTTKKTFGAATGATTGGAQTAGFWGDTLKRILPRDVIRMATVYQMKDRAGRVGATGVRRLLEELLATSETTRLHLLGHSYGAKVLLSALAAASLKPGRKTHSMLLLQPAVSHLCFAEKLPDSTAAGGYHGVPERVARPIFATYSAHDFALHEVFHRALWRSADKGEAGIAALTGAPPNIYAALGGYGPRASGEALIDITQPASPLDLSMKARLYGVDGTATISGHGDINNESTWWLSHCASWQ